MAFDNSGRFNRPHGRPGAFGRDSGRPQGNFGRPGGFGGGRPQGGAGRPSRDDFFAKARKKVQVAISSRDNLLIQTVSAVDELNKSSNLLFERLTEWYGTHFPEFKVAEPAKYVQGVLAIDRKNPDAAQIEAVFGPQAQSIMDKIRSSIGSDFSEEDMRQVRSLASQIQALWALRDAIEAYEAKIATELCPNMSHIAGPELAAKLVAQSGGLKRMSIFPSSTIQVLGAEKALFKHLRSGSRPPKHGLIFQHALISKSSRKARGKIARALAAKLAIACKADAISHNFIAEKLKIQFEAQANRILAAERQAPTNPGQ
jgi:nucleolar protein 56